MKSKKIKVSVILGMLVMIIAIIAILGMQSKAASSINYQIKIINLRPDSGLGYRTQRVGSETDNWIKIWNLVKVNEKNENEELPLYCVQAELGFMSEGRIAESITYDKAFDMKLRGDKEVLNNTYGDSNLIIAKNENADIYSKVLWLADNMYVPGEDSVEDKIEFLKVAGVINREGTYNEYTLKDKVNILDKLVKQGIMDEFNKQDAEVLSETEKAQYEEYINSLFYSEFFISDDVMEVVQQLAYWYIIHSDESDPLYNNYHKNTLKDLYVSNQEEQNAGYEVLKEYGETINVLREGKGPSYAIDTKIGQEYQRNAEILYTYLIQEINNVNSSYFDEVSYENAPYGEDGTPEVFVKINSTNDTVTIDGSGDSYIVGPYEIERTQIGEFNLETNVSVSNYKVLNSEKIEVEDIKSVVGDEIGKYQFYLSIPKTEDISTINVQFNVRTKNRLVRLLLGEDAVKEQPVLLVENKPAEQEFNIEINIKGKFKFNLIKKAQGDNGETLEGAEFTVVIKDGEEIILNTKGKTNDEGQFESTDGANLDEIPIKAPNRTYTIEITETKQPVGYIGIDKTVIFEAETYFDELAKEYLLVAKEKNSQTINNMKIQETVAKDEILIEAENRKLPTPDIHKGVESVENQDAGYYYKDLTNNTEYTKDELEKVVHDWVVETSIPEGIGKYNKYIVTDPIDTTKLDFCGLDSVKVTLINGETKEKIKDLVKGADYLVDNIDNTLTVVYIGELKGEKIKGEFLSGENVEGNKLRIEFQTTFKKDEKGIPVVLAGANIQNANNQATLTYDNGSGVDVNKPSEKPEVHTGRAAIYKYVDLNKNGKWDAGELSLEGAKFKIALSEADAKNGKYVQINGEDIEAISGEDGLAIFYGLEFGGYATDDDESNAKEDGTYRYNWETASRDYWIVETEAPEGYVKTDEVFQVKVSKNNSEIVDITKLNQAGNIKNGSFDFKLIKKDKETDEALEGAEFTVVIKDGEEVLLNAKGNTDKDGQFYETNGAKLDEISITEAGKTYTITITETKAPKGYVGIDEPVTFEATTAYDETSKIYVLQEPSDINKKSKTINNVKIQETVAKDEILIEAENRKLPTPDIHKGVESVENQNAGYYYKDLTNNQTYTKDELDKVVHDWVVETSIPEGIGKYNKYIVTDPIDTTKLDFCGLDSVKVTLINGETKEKIKDLVKGADYLVDNIDNTLTVVYIGELKGEKIKGEFLSGENVEGNKLRIEFQTTFKKDEKGIPVVLAGAEIQNAKNQATLTYDNGSGVDGDKKSEKPEVHTGRAAIYKYVDLNKNGKWDAGEPSLAGAKFKIALSEADAKNEKYVQINGEDIEAISGEDGLAIFYGLEFGGYANKTQSGTQKDETTGADVYKYNWETASKDYYIVETEAPKGYVKTDKVFPVKVSKNNSEIVDITKLNQAGNIKEKGNFEIELVKYIKDTETKLEGAEFTVTITGGKENIVIEGITNKEGKLVKQDGTPLDAIDIEDKDITYTITIKETKSPIGYEGIDEEVIITAKSKLVGTDYVLEPQSATNKIENTKNVEVKEDEILIEIENTKKPGPEIHKGIESVENQNAGYYYKDLTNNTSYTADELEKVVHDWVVETSIPEGIGDYTKYIVTDPIDTTKLDFLVINNVKVTRISAEDKSIIEELTDGEDYILEYENSILTVSYITSDFKGAFLEGEKAQEAEGSLLRIEFKTAFKKDENGIPLVLAGAEIQNAENQATLTYNNGSDVLDSEKTSEKPEVHTGKASIYKYVDLNKNGEWDAGEPSLAGAKFKIATSEENAKKGIFVKINGTELVATSGEDGIATFTGLEFGGYANSNQDNKTESSITGAEVYEYDWKTASKDYYIVETEAPEGYIKSDEVFKVTVSKNTSEIVDITKLNQVGNKQIPGKFDLALRKVITKVTDENGNVKSIVNINGEENSRTVSIETNNLYKTVDGNLITTATYKHRKDPVLIETGDMVTYQITIYNEGEVSGRATKIVDALPLGLEFVEVVNGDYTATQTDKWIVFEKKGTDNLKAFDGKDLDSETITIKCRVVATPSNKDTVLTNIAFIYEEYNEETETTITNQVGLDKDSEPSEFPKEVMTGNLSGYTGNKNKEDLSDNGYYYKGQQDDDDFEKLIMKKEVIFDLALRKFITEVEGIPVNNRYPVVKPGTDGKDFNYEHTKVPVDLVSGNTVIYTIRVYNEGPNAGYASEVMDDLPEGIIFLPEHATNVEYRWTMYKETTANTADYEYAGKKYVKTINPEEADIIVTDYLDKEVSEKAGRDSLLKAYDPEKGITETNPDYRDLKVAFKVTEPNSSDRIIINTAEITKDKDEDGNEVTDKDSTPGNGDLKEDDIDKEYIKVKEFDLALLKWVSQVSVTQDGKTTVTDTGHTVETARNEDPVLVTIDSKKIDSVVVKFIYDIRVENQGEIEGYATEVKDHIPEGLVFKAEDNPDWTQLDEKTITTDKLKDTLLKPGDTASVRVVLTWVNGSKNLNQKVNYAEISKDYNEWGVPDKDSTPDNLKLDRDYEDDEDDAPVLLTLKTGQMPVYFILGFGVLVVLAGGIYLIKKYVYRA